MIPKKSEPTFNAPVLIFALTFAEINEMKKRERKLCNQSNILPNYVHGNITLQR